MKKFKSVLVFLLSLIICFSVFPTTVFAQNFFDVNLDNYESSVRLKDGRFTYGNPPSNIAFGTYGELSVFDYAFEVEKYPLLSKGNIFHIEFDLLSPFYLNLNSTNVVLSGYTSQSTDAKSITVYAESIDITSDTLSIDFVLTQDIYLSGFRIRVVSSDVKYTCSGSTPFKFQISNCTNSLSSETQSLGNKISKFFTDLFNRLTSWFDSLFQWLKDIRDGNISFADSVKTAFTTITDNIKNFFSELGKKLTDGFINLTSSIREFFTNLGNNLKEWFKDVGNWFKEIGDRIGNFFTNLWNNISDSISSITTAVSDWWQSVKDFFHSLFVPEDGFFDSYKLNWENWAKEHFALFFDVQDILDILFNFFEGDDLEPGIVIPEIKLPFFNNPVIIPRTTFYFSQLLNQHTMIKRIYDLFQIGFSAIVYGLLLVYLQKTFSKILTDDEEAL